MRSHAFLLDLCVCGEPIFRHRLGRRQIACADVRALDQALQANAEPLPQAISRGEVCSGLGERDGEIEVGHA